MTIANWFTVGFFLGGLFTILVIEIEMHTRRKGGSA